MLSMLWRDKARLFTDSVDHTFINLFRLRNQKSALYRATRSDYNCNWQIQNQANSWDKPVKIYRFVALLDGPAWTRNVHPFSGWKATANGLEHPRPFSGPPNENGPRLDRTKTDEDFIKRSNRRKFLHSRGCQRNRFLISRDREHQQLMLSP